MGVSAIIKNGEVTNQTSTTESTEKKSNDSLDKQAFLQLLVAQLQYQDPLEPMDNTEYVSQLATFSELEQMQNMATTTELSRATQLVGNTVTVNSTNETTGVTTEVTGEVEYVYQSGSNVKISIDGTLYDLDDVVKTYSTDYTEAQTLADTWNALYALLPDTTEITAANAADYQNSVQALWTSYSSMTEYQQGFLSETNLKGMVKYINLLGQYGVYIDGATDADNPSIELTDSTTSTTTA